MSQTLTLENFNSLNIVTRTVFTNDIAAGVTSLPVENSNGFVVGTLLLGQPGNEAQEIVTATSPANATAVPLSIATKEAHNFNEPLYMLFGERIRVYRANDQYGTGKQPDDSQFSLLATIPIDGSQATTTYTDSSGTTGQWYKYTYYNLSATLETALADSEAAQAGQVHYCSLDEIREAAGFSGNMNVSNRRIAQKRAAAEVEINGSLQAIYDLPLPQPTNPIVAEITRQLAAGMLIHELYINVSPQMAAAGEAKANRARKGDGSITGLQDLVSQSVILLDASFKDTTSDENTHGFGGYPDETATDSESGLQAAYFTIDEEY
jgi:hypothetical protein